MDISTISRSTRGKFVDTPYGVYELKHYFTDGIDLGDDLIIDFKEPYFCKICNII